MDKWAISPAFRLAYSLKDDYTINSRYLTVHFLSLYFLSYGVEGLDLEIFFYVKTQWLGVGLLYLHNWWFDI